MKSMRELWEQRNRLLDIVEHDLPANGRWCNRDGGYFVPNERGSAKVRRICTAYKNEERRVVSELLRLGLVTLDEVSSTFSVHEGVEYPEGIVAIDYMKAYRKFKDLKPT